MQINLIIIKSKVNAIRYQAEHYLPLSLFCIKKMHIDMCVCVCVCKSQCFPLYNNVIINSIDEYMAMYSYETPFEDNKLVTHKKKIEKCSI